MAPPSRPRVRTIVVGGTGRVSVQPDVADLRLGVFGRRGRRSTPPARWPRDDGCDPRRRGAAGMDRRDIRTTLLSVQPRYDYRTGQPPKLTGYELANVVEVTIRDLDRLGDVIDGALGAGATSMDGLSFRVADPLPEREARSGPWPPRGPVPMSLPRRPVCRSWACRTSSKAPRPPPMPRYKADRMMVAADAATPVEAGPMEIAVSVTVTYRAR